ncbi:protein kinase [Pseudomonas coleopterorum]|uniref:protein kinase n=1 Tax=Pseudomonas coleopterorum TaxID=1605838 RepID=UPI0028A9801D|nr:protein kinase [Pseudomonas coleopterorum]
MVDVASPPRSTTGVSIWRNLPENKHIEVDTYLTLKADSDALEGGLRNADATLQELLEELNAIGPERKNLRFYAQKRHSIERSEAIHQHIIGALIETLLDSSPAEKSYPTPNSQAAIVDSITARYEGLPGLSKRSLDEKFAAARRSLSQN